MEDIKYTIPKIANIFEVAGNTIRRDINERFPEFFQAIRIDGFNQYSEDAVNVLKKIFLLRNDGRNRNQIKQKLLDENYKTYEQKNQI